MAHPAAELCMVCKSLEITIKNQAQAAKASVQSRKVAGFHTLNIFETIYYRNVLIVISCRLNDLLWHYWEGFDNASTSGLI